MRGAAAPSPTPTPRPAGRARRPTAPKRPTATGARAPATASSASAMARSIPALAPAAARSRAAPSRANSSRNPSLRTVKILRRRPGVPPEIRQRQHRGDRRQQAHHRFRQGRFTSSEANQGVWTGCTPPNMVETNAGLTVRLSLLFAERADCAFIISTHEVLLPLDNSNARTLLVRNCTYQDSSVVDWDADLLEASNDIDEELKRDVLGSRRKLLFVEGVETSLDTPLYSLLFPQVSVIPKASCRDVEHAVTSLRAAHNLHWVHAFGIVDNDRRSDFSIIELKAKGVYAVPVFSVESIYYHPSILARLAGRQHQLTGTSADELLTAASSAAFDAIRPHIQRLSERVIESSVRQELMRRLPKRSDIAKSQPIEIAIDIPAIVSEEVRRLTQLCDSSNLGAIIARYPVRETPVLHKIASGLGFQRENQYESAVRKLLMDDPAALAEIRSMFGTLCHDLATP
jgi:hypothetical protein